MLAMDPDLWADAILELMADPQRRMDLAVRARARLMELRRSSRAFPARAGA